MLSLPKLDWLQQEINVPSELNDDYPKITIITPSYNQGKFIEATIRSVLAQNYPNLEYFIFDGGSTDNTVDVIKKYDKHITFWESKEDNGQSHAINKGFRAASGDIIGWLNSDDLFYPNTLHRVANYFKDKNYRKILYGEGTFLLDKYQISVKNTIARRSQKHPITLCDFIIQPSSFWGKSVVKEVGELDENLHFGFDWDWFIKAHNKNIPFQRVEEDFSVYRIHADHKSGSGGDKRTKELAKIFRKNHGETIADAYVQLNRGSNAIWVKRILKYFPVGTSFMRKIYWKNNFKTISFSLFESILMM
ncbi:MAG: glycosyltransferase involved in cell wall biosynthesis [Neolewinella sp.]|jgi:glycosyltransferase involved in cell wall biosynthesis